jgi:hypothetical protein
MAEKQILKINSGQFEINPSSVRIKDQDFVSIMKKSPDDSIETLQQLVPTVDKDDFWLDFDGTLVIENPDLKDYLNNNPLSPIFTQGCNNCDCQHQNQGC